MKNYLILFLIIASCTFQKKSSEKSVTQAIPSNSDLIIKFHNIEKIMHKINDLKWWHKLKNIEFIQEPVDILSVLYSKYQLDELLKNKNTYLSYVLLGQDKSNFLLITPITEFQEKSNKLMRITQSSDNNLKYYENTKINHIKIDVNNKKTSIFFATYRGIFLLSFSSIIIEESIRQLKYNVDIFKIDPIKKLDQNLPKYSDLNILVKTQFLEQMIGHKNIFLNSNTWSWFDVELEQHSILLNGVTNRGNIKYLQNSQYSNAKKSTIESVLPRHTTGFYHYQINNSSDLNEVINTISEGVHENIYHLPNNMWFPKEINIAYDDNEFKQKSYVACKPKNKDQALKYLTNEQNNKITKYLNYDIIQIRNTSFETKNWLNKLIFDWENTYYINIENYIIFSNSIKKIKSLINNKIADQTIAKNKSLQTINNQTGNKTHTSFYLDFKSKKEDWKSAFNSIVSKNIASKDYFFNSIMLLHENHEFRNPTIWTFNLSSETNYKPQLVQNHYSKKTEVISQDIENNLYLINNNGELLWMKNIGNSIIGDIHQIDAYKNQKLQYLFNTRDSIYLIDRTGKHVVPFPIPNTQPMSVPLAIFDYDNNRNYRILAPMQNELKMYNQKGKIVPGWEFLKTKSTITHTPEHYQLFNKDYIVISEENGHTHLLNRKGQKRTLLHNKIHRSKTPMSLLKGSSISNSKLLTTNVNGEIIYIYFDGTIDTLKIHALKNHDQYIASNQYSLILKDYQMSFSSNNNRFEYAFRSAPLSTPKIFMHNDSIIIGIRHTTENLIYLFNETGELYGGPFFGTTDFSLGQVHEKEKLNLVVGSQEGLIYTYQVN